MPDESYMIFMAGGGRPDSLGGYDLYVSYNRDDLEAIYGYGVPKD